MKEIYNVPYMIRFEGKLISPKTYIRALIKAHEIMDEREKEKKRSKK